MAFSGDRLDPFARRHCARKHRQARISFAYRGDGKMKIGRGRRGIFNFVI
jgi:hypothetical protein